MMGDEADRMALASRIGTDGACGRVIAVNTADVSIARRAGLAVASGGWVAFPDVRGRFGTGYLSSIRDAIASHGEQVDAFLTTISSRRRGSDFSMAVRVEQLDDSLFALTSDVTRIVLPRRAIPDSGISIDDIHDELLLIDLLEG